MFKLSLTHRLLRRCLAEYRPGLYRMAYAWCGERYLAEDLVQEAILKSLEKEGQLKNPEQFPSWVFRILHNCWLMHLRKQKPEGDIEELVIPCEDCPEAIYQTHLIGQAVRQAIAGLPVGQRKVLMLVDLEGFTYKEVAEISSLPVGTVMSRISRARKSLQQALNTMRMPSPAVHLRRVK